MKALNSVFGAFPWPLTVLAVAIGPGVVEEFWCRGFLGRGLSARYGLVTGVLLTSILFALMHVDPSLLLPIALMGAYLHFVYFVTRSIWAPILLHAMNNGVSILLALTLKPEQMDQDKHVQHLNDFRAAIVDERRRLAKAMSTRKGRTEKARKDFINMQETIEAADRALADERHSGEQVKVASEA